MKVEKLFAFCMLTAACANENITDHQSPDKDDNKTPDVENSEDDDVVAERPNFVIMIADDCSHYDWGVYGRAYAQKHGNKYGNTEAGMTPNIDRFATEAMKFNRCFQQAPTSSPTRHALYTGLHSVRSGAYPNHTYVYPHVKSFVQYFEPEGYKTALAWKEHVEPKSVFAYEYLSGGSGAGIDYNAPKYNEIKRFIGERKEDKTPFFMVVASNEPHESYTLGDPSKWNPNTINIPEGYVDTPEMRQLLVKYYAEINAFDAQVGNVLRILEENGMKDNTVVMLLSEQGNSMPFAKWTCYKNGLQSAMLVRWPGHIQPGSETDALVNYIDVVPTFMDIAGMEAPDTDGKSFYKVLKGETNEHAQYSFGQQTSRGIYSGPQYYGIRSAKDGRYNYIVNLTPEAKFQNTTTQGNKAYMNSWRNAANAGNEYAAERLHKYQYRPAEELYDMIEDPWELNNLADDPAYAAKKAELRAALEAWMVDVGDLGQETEMKALERLWENAPKDDGADDGNLTATNWKKVTDNRTDWSGDYLFVCDQAAKPRVWDLSMKAKENMFYVKIASNSIAKVGTTEGGSDIPVEELYNYTATITKVNGGYTIMTANNEYITNTTGSAGTEMGSQSVLAATSITKQSDHTFEISLSSSNTAFGYYPTNERFNYFPNNKWGDKLRLSLFEFVE